MMRRIIHCSLFSVLLTLGATSHASGEERAAEVKILQPGVKLTLVTEHPDVVTPTGIDVDDKGHIWLVSSHTHFPPDDYAGPEFDEILVFDQKGNRSVFYNATHHTMDLELGDDGGFIWQNAAAFCESRTAPTMARLIWLKISQF